MRSLACALLVGLPGPALAASFHYQARVDVIEATAPLDDLIPEGAGDCSAPEASTHGGASGVSGAQVTRTPAADPAETPQDSLRCEVDVVYE